MRYQISLDGEPASVDIVSRRPELRLRIDNHEHGVIETLSSEREFAIVVGGVEFKGWRHASGEEIFIRLNGETYVLRVSDRDTGLAGPGAQNETIRAEMPGTVVSIACKAGGRVAAGDPLLTVESMKLQMTIVAPHDATVERVHVSENATFERNADLVSFVNVESAA